MSTNSSLNEPHSAIHNPKSDETSQSAIRNPKLIIIIDDSEDDILLTQMVLRKVRRTIRIETALSGEDGLALVRNGTELPALILLDLKMPRMGGLEVLHAIRADERLCRIPVIIVTHSDLESDKEASRKAGASGFLAKSVDLERFTEDIRHVLKQFENRTGD